MTMIITIEMTSEQEASLRQGIEQHDTENVQKLLAQLVAPTVEDLLRQETSELTTNEVEQILDEMAALAIEGPPLSEYALSRANMYEDETL